MEKLRTRRMAGLFLATALTVSGCAAASSDALAEGECYDDDENGYCDDNGDGTNGFYYAGSRKVFYRQGYAGAVDIDIDKKKTSTGISKGVSSGGSKPASGSISSGSKGGIGSSGVVSSGG